MVVKYDEPINVNNDNNIINIIYHNDNNIEFDDEEYDIYS
jgi:hypothetical protein